MNARLKQWAQDYVDAELRRTGTVTIGRLAAILRGWSRDERRAIAKALRRRGHDVPFKGV